MSLVSLPALQLPLRDQFYLLLPLLNPNACLSWHACCLSWHVCCLSGHACLSKRCRQTKYQLLTTCYHTQTQQHTLSKALPADPCICQRGCHPIQAAANLHGFHSFEQYISEQQRLLEFITWVYAKGVIVACIGYVAYDQVKAS